MTSLLVSLPKGRIKNTDWVQGVHLGDDPRKLAHESQDRAGRLTACSTEKLAVFHVNYNLGSNGGARKNISPPLLLAHGLRPAPGSQYVSSTLSLLPGHRTGARQLGQEVAGACEKGPRQLQKDSMVPSHVDEQRAVSAPQYPPRMKC